MSIKTRVAATAVVAACAVAFATIASAGSYYCHPKTPPKTSSGSGGGLFVGCVMGSAFGLIAASVVKGGGLKYMSQKEWEDLKVKVPNPLTNDEASLIAFTCGLGAIPVIANFKKQQPVVVRAGG